ncbi:hypothetical protein OY671_011872, partial [Metschnikowia pulcherrima]
NALGAMIERDISGECDKCRAKPFDCGLGQRIFPREAILPDATVVSVGRTGVRFQQGLADRHDAWSGNHPLDRYSTVEETKPGKQPVLEGIDRGEISVPTFRIADFISERVAMQDANAKARARAADRDRASGGQRFGRAAQMHERIRSSPGDRMPQRR